MSWDRRNAPRGAPDRRRGCAGAANAGIETSTRQISDRFNGHRGDRWEPPQLSKHAVVSRNNNGLLDVKEVSTPKQKLTDDETAALNVLYDYLGPLPVPKIARKLGWDEPRVLLALEGLNGYINL